MYLQITECCQMSCAHCCFSCGPEGKHMTMKTFNKAMEYLAGEDYITLGGGEPTLHPRFYEILMRTVGLCEYVYVITNGGVTDRALTLAKLIDKEVVGGELSRDQYHDSIDPRVVKAFGKNIRTVTTILGVGRAKENCISGYDDCACDDMLIDAEGRIWECGCKLQQFGTVWAPDTQDYEYNGDKCTKKRLEAEEEARLNEEVD